MFKLVMFILVISSFTTSAATWQITYPRAAVDTDIMTVYPIALLSLALDQTGVNYQLSASDNLLTKVKALNRLKDNREINLVWSMTNTQRESNLLPIRIPLFKGLIGWRLFVIREDMAERFKYIQSLEHLVKLSPIQGRDWPDTKILQSNGFDVVVDQGHLNLLSILQSAEGDFYPRSLVEIWPEFDTNINVQQLSVQPTLGIRYPAAVYFFVNRNNSPLAHLIETGLKMAIENGQFEALFTQTFNQYIERTNIDNRTFYDIENTFLPPETPLENSELWYQGHQ